MASFGSQVRDSIYVMIGATIPFVMRQAHGTSSEGHEKLNFIGERYVNVFRSLVDAGHRLTVNAVIFMALWMTRWWRKT